ncbi:hypothetical protein VN12_26165 [Pirellula sp. SH-Sr6A]|uniref:hypothetical protein n=1 Tax=Pirellula sp. SH-Sr6A TaxID=1632865 RepID=UPI00078C9965|nr:hypothetical protein [Pirellula sp. SH-Sr6A]AMV35605.1 hypothetical protein VN12_26165 [Pirellula sp. SH-Sr6A]
MDGFSIRDLFLLMTIVAAYGASLPNLPLLPGFKHPFTSILFGLGLGGAFVPSFGGAIIRHGITSIHCWQLALGITLASTWANLIIQYQFCLNGSKSPHWPNLAGVALLFSSPVIGFIAAGLTLALLKVTSLAIVLIKKRS